MSGEKILEEMGDASHDTPQAITITIMDPSALETTSLDSTLVTSVQAQDSSHGTGTLLMVPGEGHPSISVKQGEKDILQTVTETHMGTHELPVISNISNPEEETSEQSTIHMTTKMEGNDEEEGEVADEGEEGEDVEDPLGQHCLICNVDLPVEQTEEPVPVFKTQTTTTQRKMAVLLGSLIGQKLTSRKAHSDIMCQRCFGLLDRVDALEVEIRDTKEEIVSKYQETVAIYGGRARRRKPATAKKTDYVFPKIEPDDEDEQVLGLEMDENFEPRVEDLMEEEHDNREDCNAQDEEWEPEFKRPRIKREAADTDPNGPPKRKRGRPRKDASKTKVEAKQRGGVSGRQLPAPTRRIVTVPAAFRKCPHCPTIFMDVSQLTQHLSTLHKDHQNERHCQRCRKRFLTYEDNTACDPCLQTLRQNALPSRAGSGTSTDTATTMMCGYCHQAFDTRVLAELHCLSTGHSTDQIVALEPKTETEGPATIKVEGEHLVEARDAAPAAAATSTAGRRTKLGHSTRRGRKRRLMRKNQTACETCGAECGSMSSLYVHLRTNHPAMFPFPCGVCGRRFSIEASAREHERRHAVGELQCPACPLRFSRMSHLHHHARHRHPDFTKFPCQYCGAVKPTVDALHSHIKVHHGDCLGLPAAFSCEVCRETFHTGKALASHRSSRHPGTAVCGFCGAQVGSRYLSKHVNAVHTKEKTHRCDRCGKEFYSRTSLTGHQKRQHGPRKHLCDLCGKGYVHNVELQRHLKAHRNQRDFKCDVCGRTFLKAVDLTYHRRSHTGERPHQCGLCPEAFIRPLGLRKHMLKHTTAAAAAAKKGKRLKYSKKKIDELASSVATKEEEEAHEAEAEGGGGGDDNNNPPASPRLTQPLQVFPEAAVVAPPLAQSQRRLQPELQQLAPSGLPSQQLAVPGLDGGQLELSQVVQDLSSGELLEMGPGLILTDERGGAHEGVAAGGDGAEGGGNGAEGDSSQAPQPVQVIYVQFVEEAGGWRPDSRL